MSSDEKITIHPWELAPETIRITESDTSSRREPKGTSRNPASQRRAWFLGGFTFALLLAAGITAWLVWRHRSQGIDAILERVDRGIVHVVTGQGSGTGFVVASRGSRHLLLTNRHVIQIPGDPPAREFQIVCRGGQKHAAWLLAVGKPPEVDLAMFVVDNADLAVLGEIKTFADVLVGERVYAIGHPFGLEFTVTEGIVSAKRNGVFVQTSAAMGPGNSGGPLINEGGLIVGINTWGSRGQPLNFAIRADLLTHEEEWTFVDERGFDTVMELLKN